MSGVVTSMEDEFLQQFGLQLARILNPTLPLPTVQAAILQTIRDARATGNLPDALSRGRLQENGGPSNIMAHEIEIVFVHDCRYEILKVSEAVV